MAISNKELLKSVTDLNDKVINDFISSNKIDEKIVNLNQVLFINLKNQIVSSSNCLQIENCTNPYKGNLIVLDKVDAEKNIMFHLEPCKCLIGSETMKKLQDNYTFINASGNLVLNSLDSLIRNDDRKQLLVDLATFAKKVVSQKPTKGLYLFGQSGVGKTYIASALLNDLAKKTKQSLCLVVWPEFVRMIKSSFHDQSFNSNSAFRKITNADLLVIDDLGGENVTQWTRDELLFTILNYRFDAGKLTIITSNFDMKTLETKIYTLSSTSVEKTKASRIIDRIKGMCDEIVVKGSSRRIKDK